MRERKGSGGREMDKERGIERWRERDGEGIEIKIEGRKGEDEREEGKWR